LWSEEDDFDTYSIASLLNSKDVVFNNLDTMTIELQLGQMVISIAEWNQQLEERRRHPIPQRIS